MIKSIFISLCAVVLVIAIFAGVSRSQTGSSNGDTSNRANIGNTIWGLGLNFSPVSGFGVSGRAHFASKFSAMVTGYVAKSSGNTFYDYGLELQYDLMVMDRTRLYALAGASDYFDNHLNYTSGPQSSTNHLGIGFGLELNFISDNLCLDASIELTSIQPYGDLIIYPAAGTHYYFR